MADNDYDPIGGHTKEEAEAAYAALFQELHGERLDAFGAGDWDAGAVTGTERGRVIVVGRREPDTDSVCSAIAYARLKNETDGGREYAAYRAGRLNEETERVLRHFGVAAPPLIEDVSACGTERRYVIMVDHNEKAHAVFGIEDAALLEIIDHHRLASVKTREPVVFYGFPYGAAATIVYQRYLELCAAPDAETAGLLCAAIISDTRRFTAPETTKTDRASAVALANIAGLDIGAFADEIGVVAE